MKKNASTYPLKHSLTELYEEAEESYFDNSISEYLFDYIKDFLEELKQRKQAKNGRNKSFRQGYNTAINEFLGVKE